MKNLIGGKTATPKNHLSPSFHHYSMAADSLLLGSVPIQLIASLQRTTGIAETNADHADLMTPLPAWSRVQNPETGAVVMVVGVMGWMLVPK